VSKKDTNSLNPVVGFLAAWFLVLGICLCAWAGLAFNRAFSSSPLDLGGLTGVIICFALITVVMMAAILVPLWYCPFSGRKSGGGN
jgi:ABC-type Na+ efflux pump permease subunit